MAGKKARGLAPRQIDSRSRIALTADALEALGVGPGDFVALDVDGKAVRIRKVKISVE